MNYPSGLVSYIRLGYFVRLLGCAMNGSMRQDFDFFMSKQDELRKQFMGKIVVIKDKNIVATYDDEGEALRETKKVYPLGTFILQKVEPEQSAYIQTFHSRVAFS